MGTFVGVLADIQLTFGNLTTGTPIPREIYFGVQGSPVVLTGAAQQVAVNLNGLSYTSGLIACTWEWTEE